MLIIVESPAKAKTISKIVGKSHVVKASVGHIRKLSDDKKTTKGQKLEISGIDIDNDFTPIYEVDPGKKKVVTDLKKLAKTAKDGILLATDEDREGEAISWHLTQVLGLDPQKSKRLVFHEITKSAIKKALEKPRDLNLSLVSAQQARQVLDKLVGYKLSPVIWKVMSNNHLSAGRVQTPALRIVCDRQAEIDAFVPEEYWEIYGLFETPDAKAKLKVDLIQQEDEERSAKKKNLEAQDYLKMTYSGGQKLPKNIDSQDIVEKLTKNLDSNQLFKVIAVATKEEKSRTKPPFITSTLQQAASSSLGMSPKQTMRTAQRLYEGVDIDGEPTALITYMRTDSFNLSQESVQAARQLISKKYSKFLPKEVKYYKSKSRNAQEAHEAIRPTDPLRTPDSLKGKLDSGQWKLYDLIWRRTIACQMTDEIRERFSFELENVTKDRFAGSVARTIHEGFKAVYGKSMQDQSVGKMEVGDSFWLGTLAKLQNFTKPPSRYSPASLIRKLEELGIGRPSTYASIISTLNDRQYVETLKNVISPTPLGMKVNALLKDNFVEVTSSELTAQMEKNLDEISRGKKEYSQVLSDFWWNFKKEVESKAEKISQDRSKYRETLTDVEDPKYGDKMVLKIGRFGEYYQNPNHPEVMYPKNFRELAIAEKEAQEKFGDQVKGKKCTECGKDLIIRVSKSSLNPYIACPDYRVGNKHTVMSVSYGPCPKCKKEGRKGKKAGVLVKKSSRGRPFLSCSLEKKVCGYTQKITQQ